MAKQLVNPIERHAEKAVLAIAGLALLYVIVFYVVTTPNTIELGGERVTPSTIDERVAHKATEAAGKMRSARPTTQIPEPIHTQFAEAIKPREYPQLPLAVALGPEVPLIDRVYGKLSGQARLVKLAAPEKPTTSHGRGTFIVGGSSGQTLYAPTDWVTVSGRFDVAALREAQKREYGAKAEEVLFIPAQVQRRRQRPDGSWSDNDWKDIACFPTPKLPREPAIQLLMDDTGKLTVDREVLKQIEDYQKAIAATSLQLDIIRPMPPDMLAPTRWAMPIITSLRDVLLMDDEYMFPNEPPAKDPVDRYGLSGAAGPSARQKVLTPEEQRKKDLEDAQKLIQQARQNQSVNDARKAYNLAVAIVTDRAASPAEKDRATKIRDEAEQAERDVDRALKTVRTSTTTNTGPAVGVRPAREKLPVQQLWGHDAAEGSVENGAVYQYRMRFRVFNLLAGNVSKLSDPEDAAVLLLESDWSPPSDPVEIPPSSIFFVTSEDQKDQQISVDFFQWYLGRWLKPERRIKATIGQTLTDKQRVPAPAIDNPDVVDRPEIEFVADATVIDIDFDRPFRDRKAGTGPKGVKFAAPAGATAVVFMDSQGRLSERLVPIDKADPAKRMEVWTPPKAKP